METRPSENGDAGKRDADAAERESGSDYRIMTVEEYEAAQAAKTSREADDSGKTQEAVQKEQSEKQQPEHQEAKTTAPHETVKETVKIPAATEKIPAAIVSGSVGGDRSGKDNRKDNSTKYFLIIAAVVILLTAVFFSARFFRAEPKYETVTYNGFTFQNYGGLWNTQWKQDGQLFNLRLHFNPYQVENVTILGDEGWSAKQTTFITFDPEGNNLSHVALAAAELSLSLSNTFGMVPVAACTRNTTDACASRPIVSCESYQGNASVIYLKAESPAKITLGSNCAVVQGVDAEIVRAAEKAVYQWYGIIKASSSTG